MVAVTRTGHCGDVVSTLQNELTSRTRLRYRQPGDDADAGSAREAESVSVALTADLLKQLTAVGRAEERIAQGTYGRSVESGVPIPDERLEAEPLAERTIEEQRHYERHGSE
jgi:DnaK suppressor protein